MINKTVINDNIINYCNLHNIVEPSLLQQLRQKSEQLNGGHMLISASQGGLLYLISKIANVQTALEIGTFTGYSTAWLGLAISQTASLITIDINDRYLALARECWMELQINDKITAICNDASLELDHMLDEGRQFDLVFIDANKTQYPHYYEQALGLLNSGGLVILDNVLMYGKVLETSPQKNYIKSLQQLNNLINNDNRVEACMLPIGDGLTIARKK